MDDGHETSDFGMIIRLVLDSAFSSEETSLVIVEWQSRINSIGPGLCGGSYYNPNYVGKLLT